MNAMTLAFINMLEALKTMVNANMARFTVIPAFTDAWTEITTRLTAMQALKPIAIQKTKPKTDANSALKIELSQKTVEVADTVRSLAGKLGDIALKEEMILKQYKLERLAQGILTATCQNIHTTATAHKVAAAAYNLTQDMLDDLQALITEYAAEVPEVRTEEGVISTARKSIEKYKGECELVLEDQLDPMVKILQKTDAGALNLWNTARVVIAPPSTTTQVKYKVFTIDNGVEVPISDVPIIATGKIIYTAITNSLGEAIMKPVIFGLYDITVTMPDYLPFLLKDYKVVRGKINKLEIVLIRAV